MCINYSEYTAKFTKKNLLKNKNIDCSAPSPKPNPIVNLLSMAQTTIREDYSTNCYKLWKLIQSAWYDI